MNKIMRLIIIFSLILLLYANAVYTAETQKHTYRPENGYVPDQETAIKIAVAVWTPIYGKKQIEKELPYKAILKNGIWYVSGSLPKNSLGDVAEAEVSKENGCIIRISHGQ